MLIYLNSINISAMQKNLPRESKSLRSLISYSYTRMTDSRKGCWMRCLPPPLMDMASVGARQPDTLPAMQICERWMNGFKGIDAIHHQAGTYLVTVADDSLRRLRMRLPHIIKNCISGTYSRACRKLQFSGYVSCQKG